MQSLGLSVQGWNSVKCIAAKLAFFLGVQVDCTHGPSGSL